MILIARVRPAARIDFGGGGVQNPQNVDLLDPKSGLFEPHPLNPLTNTLFFAHFVAKSGPFGKFGGVHHTHSPPPPPGYGPGPSVGRKCMLALLFLQWNLFKTKSVGHVVISGERWILCYLVFSMYKTNADGQQITFISTNYPIFF